MNVEQKEGLVIHNEAGILTQKEREKARGREIGRERQSEKAKGRDVGD